MVTDAEGSSRVPVGTPTFAEPKRICQPVRSTAELPTFCNVIATFGGSNRTWTMRTERELDGDAATATGETTVTGDGDGDGTTGDAGAGTVGAASGTEPTVGEGETAAGDREASTTDGTGDGLPFVEVGAATRSASPVVPEVQAAMTTETARTASRRAHMSRTVRGYGAVHRSKKRFLRQLALRDAGIPKCSPLSEPRGAAR